MKNRIKQALSILDGVLALVCLVIAARCAAPMSARVQLGMVIVGFLAVFFAVTLCFIFSQKQV